MKRYNPSDIEPKWQQIWNSRKTYEVQADPNRIKTYVSGMFPYPSGAGMHAGHAFSYSIVDAIARFHRGLGNNVLNPMGWDAFGLPTENYAIKTGTAPAVVTAANIANFKQQFTRMGVSIDWSREINTTDPEYYRWTQWVFARLFERGLAYQKESLQWWCPVDKTVLANEQVEGGHCWRCGSEVIKKSLNQWFFKITEYADALLEELDGLDWPQKIKTAQANWIGKSEGAEVEFKVDGRDDIITVFSTRPDTLFGATFLVLAPEHPLARSLMTDDTRETVTAYIDKAVKESEIERTNDTREKTGVFTGSYAVNPVTGENVPIWIADYVLGGYGTGAIMAVPAHDERDHAFAKKFGLPITNVINPVAVRQDARDKEIDVQKSKIVAVVTNDQNEILTINWGSDYGGRLLIGGTVESDEAPDKTALREVTEETGYTDLDVEEVGQETFFYTYYAFSKQETHEVEASFVKLRLKSDARESQRLDESEKNKFSVEWVSSEQGERGIVEPLHRYAFDKFILGKSYGGEGVLVNSGAFDGQSSSEARDEIVGWLEKQGTGRAKTTYRMRDWLISRQRYWGAPIPIIHCPEHGAVAVPDDQLPVVLPEVTDYLPTGEGTSVLASVDEWVNTSCPKCGGPAKRETDTMDGYACSSWYLLRYADPHGDTAPWDPEKANYWMPVDFYVGGDHAVAHLLYVRFWTHVFHEMGLTGFKEPVKKLVYHGYINAPDGSKMSKSKGNVVDPLDVIDQGYGADALRTYVLFMGPVELDAPWDPKGIAGVYRFLNRVWTLTQEFLENPKDITKNDAAVRRVQNKTVKKVTDDYHRLSFNTAIAAMMEYVNELYKLKTDGFSEEAWREALGALVRLLAPLAPHMSAELWQQLGNESMIEEAGWPAWDDALIASDTMKVVVQVNGRVRAHITVPSDTSEEDVKAQALKAENVIRFVGDKKPAKVIYVSGRLVNVVV